MRFKPIDKRLSKLERVSRPGIPQRAFIVQYEYPAKATAEEMEAAKAAAMDRFQKEHPELEGRRVPIIILGLARGDIALPGEEEP
jgi:hypothetical protein